MADTIRFGKVSNIDYETGCMEITYEDRGDSVTDMIPMLANAGYKMPQVGETVAVAHNSNGEEEGIVLGTVWARKPNRRRENRISFDRTSTMSRGNATSGMTEKVPSSTMKAIRTPKQRKTKPRKSKATPNWK